MSSMSFKLPRETVYGAGALNRLAELNGTKAVVVTGGSSMKKYGFIEKVEKLLNKAGIEAKLIDGVEPNPSVETVNRGAREMLDFNPDWIIAVGGGSAIDAAKIMWCFYEHPDLTLDDIVPVNSMPELRRKARFVAIPSTSGTASEVTAFSVITDPEKHIKYPIVSPEIIPDLAILDSELPARMPVHVTVNTGMDAMSHAVESVASTAATDFTEPLALRAIKLIGENLVKVYMDPGDISARTGMHNASTLAGQAFSNSSLGLVHALAHKAGGEFGITHGLCNAILLPYVVKFNRQFTDKYREVEKTLGIENLEEYLFALNRRLEIPRTLAEVNEVDMSEKKFLSVLERMSRNAHEDPCRLTNPGNPTVEDVAGLYRKAFYGK